MKGSSGSGSSGSTAATRGVRVQAKVVRRGDTFRVVGAGDGRLLRGSRGRPVDGGGHWNEAKALRQCGHIASLQGTGHLVDRTLQGVVQIQESKK